MRGKQTRKLKTTLRTIRKKEKNINQKNGNNLSNLCVIYTIIKEEKHMQK